MALEYPRCNWQKHSRNLTSSKNSKNSHILLGQISQKPLEAENKQPHWINLMVAETDQPRWMENNLPRL